MTVALLDQVEAQSSPRERESSIAELDDAGLVASARQGQAKAFEQLYVRHQRRLRRNACSIVTGADLDDVSQRAWLKIYRKLHTLREPRFFYAWASRIMVNTALAYVRKQGRRSETDIDDLPPSKMPVDRSPDVAEKTGWQGLLVKTRRWFGELEARDRKIFRHFLVDGMTMEEIGEQVGLSSGGVKTRLFRARQTLRARRDALANEWQ